MDALDEPSEHPSLPCVQHETVPRCRAPSAGLQKTQSLWLAETPSKRWAELFFLWYSPVWIIWALGIVVPFQLYEVRH